MSFERFVRKPAKHILPLVALAAVAAPTAATAQLKPEPRVGSRLPVKPQTFDEDVTRKTVREFGYCVANRQRKLASQFVLDRSTLDFDRKYRLLADGDCLVSSLAPTFDAVQLKLAGESMRFALAEALLEQDLGSINPAALTKAAPLPLPPVSAKAEERTRSEAALVLYRFGECVVRSNPLGARRVLESKPESAAELAAIQADMEALSNCVVKGAEFKLDRARVRGALAFAYYSLAHAQPATE